MRIVKYAEAGASSYDQSKVIDGVAVALDPVTDPAELKTHFGTNLLDEDVLPVRVRVENRSNASTVIVDPDDIYVGRSGLSYRDVGAHDAGGRLGAAADTTHKAAGIAVAVGAAASPAVSVVAAPIAVVSAGRIGAAKEVRRNLLEVQLHSKTLAPGESVSGFVYFPAHVVKDGAGAPTVVVNLSDTDGHARVFNFSLRGGPE